MSRNCSPVIFVPGIGGSRLRNRNTGKVVWGNLETMFGDLQKISLPDRDTDLIEATEVIDKIVIFCPFQTSFYGEIETFLCKNLSYARDKDLFFFCYDWRQDCAVSAEKLKEYIGERYDQLGKKLTIVAHSMGGLIARYCTDCLEAHQYVDKIIALGTPHRGSPNALESLLKGACVFPGGFRRQETLKCLKTFPSAYQLLPTLGSKEVYIQDDHMSPVDIFKELDWLGTKSEQSQYGSLVSNAKIFHDRLTKARSNSSGRLPTIYSVYGYGQHTLMQITVPRDDSNRWNLASYFRNRNGDKTVPEDSAIFYRNPNQICPVSQPHGSIFNDKNAHAYLENLLCHANNRYQITEGKSLLMVLNDCFLYEPEKIIRAFIGLVDEVGKLIQGVRFTLNLFTQEREIVSSVESPPPNTPESKLRPVDIGVPAQTGGYILQASVEPFREINPVEEYIGVKKLQELGQ